MDDVPGESPIQKTYQRNWDVLGALPAVTSRHWRAISMNLMHATTGVTDQIYDSVEIRACPFGTKRVNLAHPWREPPWEVPDDIASACEHRDST
jgi:hypothetical protein